MTRDEMLDKREDVLEEFDAQVDVDLLSLEEKRWYTAELLADEVVQLRKQLDSSERILALLREPSDFVIEAIDATAWDQGCARLGLPACALVARAAVAAAEQEVAGE